VASGLIQALPPPNPALAEAVRAGRWAEVRTLTATVPRPLSPTLALVMARAERTLGEPARALDLLRPMLPRAGELAAAVRLEAAEASLALGQDPLPFLAPLLSSSSPAPHRRAAQVCLRRAWEVLPLSALRRVPLRSLQPPLRRELAVAIAVRGEDDAAALHVLAGRVSDEATLRAAHWLAGREGLPPSTRLAIAEALLVGGEWREAEALLAALSPPEGPTRFRWAFLRGRAAYRLGKLPFAADAFNQALAAATSDQERFEAAVQRARTAEIAGDLVRAVGLWDTARAARSREVQGWDGALRLRVALGRAEEAVDLARGCPGPVLRVVGPRLAASLLLRNDTARAQTVLPRVPTKLPAVRALAVARLVKTGDLEAARSAAASLLADQRAGPWREQVLALLPATADDAPEAQPTRDIEALAAIAARRGAAAARAALAAALATDPAWAPVLAGPPPEPTGWTGAARDLAAVGLEREAAALYPDTFPGASPSELAWSARTLAAWGNRPAALTAGEQLWGRLAPLPAVLLPETLLPAILPPELVAACVAAAREQGVPAPWLVGIIRQESRFDVDAFSGAGAIGVAQFVPEAARRLGATPAELREGDRAVRLAAWEVARLTERFGPHLARVAAAYNAGETVVASWLSQFGDQPEEMLLTAAIPYGETAGYVLAVHQGVSLAAYLK
jgi:soluble lytic murein transglycosylase-like protein